LPPSFSALVQQFFTDYLLAQRAMSPNTVASYRDAMLLFLDFAHERLDKTPTELRLVDIEPDLIIGQPGSTWISQRDHLLLTMLYNTGARVSEIVAVRVADVVLDASACVHLHGKGRKQRAVPLWKSTVQEVRAWLRCSPALAADAPSLPNRDGRAMTRNNVNQRLAVAGARAAEAHPSLAKRRVSPHMIRHSTAMHRAQGRSQARCGQCPAFETETPPWVLDPFGATPVSSTPRSVAHAESLSARTARTGAAGRRLKVREWGLASRNASRRPSGLTDTAGSRSSG
jgi:site-specific recombinase XerD